MRNLFLALNVELISNSSFPLYIFPFLFDISYIFKDTVSKSKIKSEFSFIEKILSISKL